MKEKNEKNKKNIYTKQNKLNIIKIMNKLKKNEANVRPKLTSVIDLNSPKDRLTDRRTDGSLPGLGNKVAFTFWLVCRSNYFHTQKQNQSHHLSYSYSKYMSSSTQLWPGA